MSEEHKKFTPSGNVPLLSDEERNFLLRFCWEVYHRYFGKDSLAQKHLDIYWDLADLATVSNCQMDFYTTTLDKFPIEVPSFPWKDGTGLKNRLKEYQEAVRNHGLNFLRDNFDPDK
jgi:hypothetical protein